MEKSHGGANDAGPSADAPADLQAVIDGQSFWRFGLLILLTSVLVMVAEGYDLQLAPFAAPSLAREWGVPRTELAPFLAASVFGIMAGAPLFGWAGDRFGRKPAVLVCLGVIALFTILCGMAGSLGQLIGLRGLAGLGIGGLIPNMVALNTELAPLRHRGLRVSIMFVGLTLGAALPGVLIGTFPAMHVWRNIFFVGAAVAVAAAVLVALVLPEAPVRLARRPDGMQRLQSLLARMRPDLDPGTIDPSRWASPLAAHGARKAAITDLFSAGLAPTTLAIWALYILMFLSIHLLTNWTPLLLEDSGLSPQQAAFATSGLHFGGAVGSLLVSLTLDRRGWLALGGMLLLGGGAAVAAGTQGLTIGLLPLFIALCGIGLVGAQAGVNAAAGLVYPEALRARGAGLALGIGRIGSLSGPFLGAILAGGGADGRHLYLVAAIPILLGATIAMGLARATGGRRIGAEPLEVE